MKKSFLSSLISLTIFFAAGSALVFAQTPGGSSNPPPPGSASNPVSVTAKLVNPFNCGNVSPCTLYDMFKAIINDILLPIGGVLAVMAFIYSGFLYVTAQGNDAKLKTAHTALLYTAIGTAILLGAWVIAMVVENTISQLTV